MMAKNAPKTVRYATRKRTLWQKPGSYVFVMIVLAFLSWRAYQIPAIQNQVNFYYANLRADLLHLIHPPSEVSFGINEEAIPKTEKTAVPELVLPTIEKEDSPTIMPTQKIQTTETDSPLQSETETPVIEATPIPIEYRLSGVKEEYQTFNNCGPTNLSIALSYWGWQGTQHTTEKVLKPRWQDRNVMPSEMLEYVLNETDLKGQLRYGGDLDLVKRFVAAGIPVMIERGYMNEEEGWMGHYGIITGYNDNSSVVRIPDSYIGNISIGYEEIELYWAQFADVYLVIYPEDRESEILEILGQQTDVNFNLQHALAQVTARIDLVEGRELFFAWYSRGVILTKLGDYWEAANAFDKAFQLYREMPVYNRPWRINWYQDAPLEAYYRAGRFGDVINLADKTLDTIVEDALPEVWYWRGKANLALGDTERATKDFKQALDWQPGWALVEAELQNISDVP